VAGGAPSNWPGLNAHSANEKVVCLMGAGQDSLGKKLHFRVLSGTLMSDKLTGEHRVFY
jgi:hypothetical protein